MPLNERNNLAKEMITGISYRKQRHHNKITNIWYEIGSSRRHCNLDYIDLILLDKVTNL